MRKLSFFILGIILLFVTIFAATPYFAGSLVNSEKLSRIFGDAKNVRIIHYKRHWFNSEASLLLNSNALVGLHIPNTLALHLHMRIEHGPLVSYTLDGHKYRKLAKAVIFLTAKPAMMKGQIIILLDWDGSISKHFAIDSFNSKINHNSLLIRDVNGTIKEEVVNGTLTKNSKIAIAQLSSSYDSQAGVTNQYAISNFQSHGENSKQAGLWIGNNTNAYSNFILMRNNSPLLAFKNLQTNTDTTLANGLVNFTAHTQAASASFAKEPLGTFSMDLAAKHIDVNALQYFMKQVKTINHLHLSATQLLLLLPSTINLLEKGLVLDLTKFRLNIPNLAPVSLQAQLSFVKAGDGIHLFNLTQHIQAHGVLTLPEEFLIQQLTEFYQNMMISHHQNPGLSAEDRAKQTLNTWINNKMLKKGHNNTVLLSFKAENGTLLINGHHPNFLILKVDSPIAKKPL